MTSRSRVFSEIHLSLFLFRLYVFGGDPFFRGHQVGQIAHHFMMVISDRRDEIGVEHLSEDERQRYAFDFQLTRVRGCHDDVIGELRTSVQCMMAISRHFPMVA